MGFAPTGNRRLSQRTEKSGLVVAIRLAFIQQANGHGQKHRLHLGKLTVFCLAKQHVRGTGSLKAVDECREKRASVALRGGEALEFFEPVEDKHDMWPFGLGSFIRRLNHDKTLPVGSDIVFVAINTQELRRKEFARRL